MKITTGMTYWMNTLARAIRQPIASPNRVITLAFSSARSGRAKRIDLRLRISPIRLMRTGPVSASSTHQVL
jgi:hypothetical protein